MRTLGIDLAAQAKGTAACLVHWEDGRAEVEDLRGRLANDELLDGMRGADVVGIDAPFGWPVEFADAVRSWSEEGRWRAGWHDRDGCLTLRLRETDRWVAGKVGKHPLSVSSDRIAIVAWRAAALLERFHDGQGARLDRVSGKVREVYPAAALIRWRLVRLREPTSYKRTPAACEALADALLDHAEWLTVSTEQRSLLRTSADALDALVSALAARAAVRDDLTTPPPVELDPARIAIEGWIWVPREGSLNRLAAA